MRFTLSFLLLLLLAVVPAIADDEKGEGADDDGSPFQAKTFKGLKLRSIGPALMSGRIADIAVHPQRQSTWYVAAGSGNLWKTVNAGTTWTPIFDDQGSYSIGCVQLDPSNPEVVWVGTGENVNGRHVGYGDGIYVSRDGGTSWKKMGLEHSEHIGRIVIDPRDSNVLWVAAQGPLWSKGGDRGLLQEHRRRCYVDQEARRRRVDRRQRRRGRSARSRRALRCDAPAPSQRGRAAQRRSRVGHPQVHRRRRDLARGHQGPAEGGHGPHRARGVPACPRHRLRDRSSWAHRKGGFWRSTTAGESWEKRNDIVAGATGPHYYQEIFACPHQRGRVYMMDMKLRVTEDGGKTWRSIGTDSKHVDNHALAFNPHDPGYLLVGCDGGVYESWDLGKTYRYVANLPLTQFYKVAVDYDEPFYNVYGGTQDNNTQGGPSRTDNVHGIRNSDWFTTLWGDGHQPAADPSDPNIVYSQWQVGNLTRYDRKTGEFMYIQPQPADGEPVGSLQLGRADPHQLARSEAAVLREPARVAQQRSRRQLDAGQRRPHAGSGSPHAPDDGAGAELRRDLGPLRDVEVLHDHLAGGVAPRREPAVRRHGRRTYPGQRGRWGHLAQDRRASPASPRSGSSTTSRPISTTRTPPTSASTSTRTATSSRTSSRRPTAARPGRASAEACPSARSSGVSCRTT